MTFFNTKIAFLPLALIILFFSNINSQKKKGIDLINEFSTKIVEAKEIVYYGWDFTQVKLFDGDFMGSNEDELKVNIVAIIGLLSERYTPEKMSDFSDIVIIP